MNKSKLKDYKIIINLLFTNIYFFSLQLESLILVLEILKKKYWLLWVYQHLKKTCYLFENIYKSVYELKIYHLNENILPHVKSSNKYKKIIQIVVFVKDF